MKILCCLIVSGNLFAPVLASAQDKADDSEGIGLFDFDDIEKHAREETDKLDKAPKSVVPAEVQAALATLKAFQELSAEARDEMILQNRKSLAANLKAAAEKVTAAETREKLILEAAAVADSEAGAALPAPGRKYSLKTESVAGRWEDLDKKHWGATLFPDGSAVEISNAKGTWRWIDEPKGIFILDWQSPYATLYQISGSSPVTATTVNNDANKSRKVKREAIKPAYNPAPERDALLQKAAEKEKAINAAVAKAVEARRKQLLEDLKQRSATSGPELARAFEAEAAAVKEHRTEFVPRAEKLAGDWKNPGGNTLWQFRRDGTLLSGGKPAGTWLWAKAATHSTMLFCVLPQREWGIARFSKSELGVLRINKFGVAPYDMKRVP